MYRLSTYFYWCLILYIRIYRYIEFIFLRILRGPINKVIVWGARKHGIIINWGGYNHGGSKPTGTHQINVHNPNTFIRIINQGNLGLGESYMEGWWDAESSEELQKILLLLWNIFGSARPHPIQRLIDWVYLNADDTPWDIDSGNNGWARSLGSYFTQISLGPNQSYNAGIWNNIEKVSTNLENAQFEAMRQLGEHLKLSPGMKVLDLGCGHGALARYLADTYNVSVTGVTHSLEESMAAMAYENKNVKILQKDYRELPTTFNGKFDSVIAIHLIEHLKGPKHYKEFFDTVNKCLKPGGLFVLQTYVMQNKIYIRSDQLTRKYLYSSSVVPHYLEIMGGIRDLFHVVQIKDLSENMETFYSVLDENFENGWHLLQPRYDIKYYRLLKLTLAVSIVMGKGKKLQDWVLVLSKIE